MDEFGSAVAGVEISAHHRGLAEDVADWIADGRVQAPSGLVSNAAGQVVLKGLPRGQVVCSADGALAITVTVPALALGEGTLGL